MLGIPKCELGEFGVFCDVGMHNAYDVPTYLTFADGYPIAARVLNRTTWQSIEQCRAMGVGFTLTEEA